MLILTGGVRRRYGLRSLRLDFSLVSYNTFVFVVQKHSVLLFHDEGKVFNLFVSDLRRPISYKFRTQAILDKAVWVQKLYSITAWRGYESRNDSPGPETYRKGFVSDRDSNTPKYSQSRANNRLLVILSNRHTQVIRFFHRYKATGIPSSVK